jgi:hypothetical protein
MVGRNWENAKACALEKGQKIKSKNLLSTMADSIEGRKVAVNKLVFKNKEE